ncbi:MAG: heme exporter protein CcmD [Alphaproteobacteria bacterium]|nr:heme exporter protein CcmD [Alphaproteobacteria bacterium]
MDDFLAMGGYGAYVWPAYGIAVGAVGGLIALSLRRYWRAFEALEGEREGE